MTAGAAAPRRAVPPDAGLALLALLVSWTVALATPDVSLQVRLLAAGLAVLQAASVLLVGSRPTLALLLVVVTKPLQYLLILPLPDIGWLFVAYLLLRNRARRAVLLLGGSVVVTCLITGVGRFAFVDPGRVDAALGFAAGLLAVLGPQLAAAAALGWVVRTARERAAARREAGAARVRVAAVEAERARIGDELNGLVVQVLHRLVARTEQLRSRLTEPPPSPADALAGVQAEARQALAAMRRGLGLLRSADPAASPAVAPPDPQPRDGPGSRLGRVPGPTPSGVALMVALGVLILLVDAVVPAHSGIPELDRVAPLFQVQDGLVLTLPLLALQLAALGWWRSAPLGAFAVGTLGAVGSGLNHSSHIVTEYSWMFLVYGVGLGVAVLASAVAVAAGTAAVLVVVLAAPRLDFTPVELVGGFLLVAPLWAVGALRRRSSRRAELESARRAAAQTHTALHDERHRIARDLHDVIAHHVSAIAVQAGAARTPGVDPGFVDAAVTFIEEYGRRTRDALPALVGLSPPTDAVALDRDGVEALVAPVRAAGLPVIARVRGTAGQPHGDVELFAHRILVEALTNVLRHAGATPTTLTVDHDDDAVTVSVVDGGPVVGHRASPEGSGLGLIGMRERAQLLGGEVHAGPGAAGGWSVRARLPRRGNRGLLLGEEAAGAGSSLAPTRRVGSAT